MEKLLDTGLVRGIGISNFNSEQVERLLANCTVKPLVNQIEVGPSRTQKKLIKFCRDRDIQIIGFSPLGRPHYSQYPDMPQLAFLDNRVVSIGEKYGKTGAQVILRYLVNRRHFNRFYLFEQVFFVYSDAVGSHSYTKVD